jgi:PAS domain-containing protein
MDPSPEERGRTGLRALGITLISIAFGTAWILLSDRVAEVAAEEISRLAVFQRLKGLAYVALTGGALFLLIRQGMIRVHRAAVRLRKSERESARLGHYLRAIIDASPLAIFDLSAHGSIDSIWNPAAERFFGISRLRALGTVPRFVAGDHTRLEVGVEVAIPLGLLLHELLAGALQDGCADHTGSVNVTLCRIDGHLELGFSSDCGGVSAGTTGGLDRGSRPDALPSQLIAALVNQMAGELLVGATGHITVRVAEPSGSGTG